MNWTIILFVFSVILQNIEWISLSLRVCMTETDVSVRISRKDKYIKSNAFADSLVWNDNRYDNKC